MAADSDGYGVSAAKVVELEAGFAPLEAAFTAPSFCRRVMGRLSAPEFRELYADGGTATIASIARWDCPLKIDGEAPVVSIIWLAAIARARQATVRRLQCITETYSVPGLLGAGSS